MTNLLPYDTIVLSGKKNRRGDNKMNLLSLSEFTEYLKTIDTSEGTIYNYVKHNSRMIEFFELESYEGLNALGMSDYFRFISQLKSELSASTVNNYIRSITRYTIWAKDFGHIESDVFRNIKFGKGNRRFVSEGKKNLKYITSETIDKMKNVARSADERLMLVFMEYSGCRIGEVVNAKVSDIFQDEDGSWRLHIPKTKTGASRQIFLKDEIANLIFNYVENRPEKDAEHIFVGKRTHEGISTTSAWERVKDLARLAGLSEEDVANIHPHVFRHKFGTDMAEAGFSKFQIGGSMGHIPGSKATDIYMHRRDGANDNLFESQVVRI